MDTLDATLRIRKALIGLGWILINAVGARRVCTAVRENNSVGVMVFVRLYDTTLRFICGGVSADVMENMTSPNVRMISM